MKGPILGTILLASVIMVPIPAAMAQVSVHVNIGLPPPVVFEAPLGVVVLPDTDDVYVVPGVSVDLFFWDGWWWRLWDGRWYRSHYYDRAWAYYGHIPRFYYDVDPSWRVYYRDREWRGYPWHYERIPERRLHQNWSSWRSNGYWQRQRTWDVNGYRPLPPRHREDLRNWRQEQYRQRPEYQRYPQQRQPHVEEPRRGQQPREHMQHGQPHGGPEGRDGDHRR